MKRFLLLSILPLLMASTANDTVLTPKKNGGSVVIKSVTSGGVSSDAVTVGTSGAKITSWDQTSAKATVASPVGLVQAGAIPGNTTGAAAASGNIGEALGSTFAGVGGSAILTSNTTAMTNSRTAIISRTLNKGSYLIGYTLNGNPAAGLAIYHTLRVGGTYVVNEMILTTSSRFNISRAGIPVNITADGTVVDVYAMCDVSSVANVINELYVIRVN